MPIRHREEISADVCIDWRELSETAVYAAGKRRSGLLLATQRIEGIEMYAFTLKNGFSIFHNGYEVLISKDYNMWLFDRQDG